METSDIIALVLGATGFTISIIGYVVTPLINLKSKRLEKRLEHRFQLFDRIIEMWEFTYNDNSSNPSKLIPHLLEINKKIQLYGHPSEIITFKKVVDSYNRLAADYTEENKKKLISDFNHFFSVSSNTYRKEIILDKLPD